MDSTGDLTTFLSLVLPQVAVEPSLSEIRPDGADQVLFNCCNSIACNINPLNLQPLQVTDKIQIRNLFDFFSI